MMMSIGRRVTTATSGGLHTYSFPGRIFGGARPLTCRDRHHCMDQRLLHCTPVNFYSFNVRGKSVAVGEKVDTDAPKPYHDIPGPRGLYRVPHLGTILLYKPFTKYTPETTHEMISSIIEKYGPIVRFCLGKPSVFITDPEDIAKMFQAEGKFPRRTELVTSLTVAYTKRNGTSATLGQLNGPDWKRVRTALNKIMMRTDSATYYLGPQNEVADAFVNVLATQKLSPEKLEDLLFKYASECIGVACFNKRLGLFNLDGEKDPETDLIIEYSKDLFKAIHDSLIGNSVLHNVYPNKTYRKFETSVTYFRSISLREMHRSEEILDKKIRDGTFDPDEPNLLYSLLSNKTLSEEDIQNSLLDLYVAGTDSTSRNLLTFLYNLAKYPDVQEKLFDEIRSVKGDEKMLTGEAIQKMSYLKACLKENFRLYYPTVLGASRIFSDDIVLQGYQIPKGVTVFACNQFTCKANIPEPERYIPERWMRAADKSSQSGLHPMANLPFGFGLRSCIGRRFAEQELYLAAVKVVEKLKIEIEPGSEDSKFIYELFVKPKNPVKFVFKERK